MNSKIVFIYMVFLIMGIVVFNGTVGQAAVIHVTTTQDKVPGSLRAAITTANTNNQDNTIYIPAGTYYLSGAAGEDANAGGDLDIDTSFNLTIIGEGKTKTDLDGNGIDRVLHILNGTVTITDLTIRKGNANIPLGYSEGDGLPGGGIYNSGNLTLTRCVIKKNSAGDGIGDYWERYCFCYIGYGGGNGGGIYNEGVLVLNWCTITNNKGGDGYSSEEYGVGGSGGGIFNKGNLTLSGCTVSNNVTGIGEPTGQGGGIYNAVNAFLKLINCTISGNQTGSDYFSAAGGGIYNDGISQLIGVTVVYNDESGIFNKGSIQLKNSIAANNTGGYYGYGPDCSGTFNWVSYSLIEDTSGCILTGFQKANILGKDPVLGPLQDNGGPTFTHALLPNSPAIDAGNSSELSEDQRGFTRPVDIPGIANASDGADIGAYEFNVSCAIAGTITYGGTGMAEITLTFSNNGGSTATDADGHYSHNVLYNWSGSVTPAKEGYTFSPSSRNYTTLTANQSNQDYTAVSLIPPQISLLPTQLYFGADTSGKQTGPQSFLISNSGGGFLNWTAAVNAAWLTCNPTTGTGPALVTVSINPSGLATKTYTGTIEVEDPNAVNSPQIVTVTLTVYDAGSTHLPFGSFDTPIDGAGVTGSIPVTGWALDNLGIEYVKIYRDPAAGEGSGLIYIGAALLVEGARPDIEAAYPGYPNNYQAGWGYMLLTYGLPNQGNGTFTLYAIAGDKEGNLVTLGSKTIYGDNARAVKPFGAIDAPAQGGTASGSDYPNYGWALTPLPNTIPSNGSTITLWVDGVPLGHPVYNENRPDVAALFPGYNNSTGAGGHFLLDTTVYDNGLHTISWSVIDNVGNSDGIGSRYFIIQNLSSGTAQGEIKATNYKIQITNKPQSQNYKLQTEEVPFGQAAARPTQEGLIGTAPRADHLSAPLSGRQGFGETLFTTGHRQPATDGLLFEKGYNPESKPETLYPDENGLYTVEIKELERVVIYLDDQETGNDNVGGGSRTAPTPKNIFPSPGKHYLGYLVNGDQLKPLPIGSTLDAERGIFYWQPGPGFLGVYELVFITGTGPGEMKRKQLTIKISPIPMDGSTLSQFFYKF